MDEAKPTPTVIHLGKKSRKDIRNYQQGVGTMFIEVQQLVEKARESTGKNVLPLVVVHRKKRKKLLQRGLQLFRF